MDKIYIERFRLINDPIEIDIKPITILTGQNNSGKSSIIKALLLLSDFLEQEQQLHLDYTGKYATKHKLFGFENTHNWFSEEKSFIIGFKDSENIIKFEFIGNDTLKKFTLNKSDQEGIHFENNNFLLTANLNLNLFERTENLNIEETKLTGIYYNAKKKAEELAELKSQFKLGSKKYLEITSLERANDKKTKELEKRLTALRAGGTENIVNSEIELSYNKNQRMYNLSIADLTRAALSKYYSETSRNEFVHNQSINVDLYRYFNNIRQILSTNIHYLGPNRTFLSRLYLSHNSVQEINEVSNEYAKNKPRPASSAKEFLLRWLNLFGVGNDLAVESYENAASSIRVKIDGVKEPINLADKGYGAGQITTVLLKIANLINQITSNQRKFVRFRKESPILIIEEPEANLHPRYQSLLAELFYEVYYKYGIKFILETHSEYLIRKLQVLTAKQEIDPETVVIYYLDKTKEHCVVLTPIDILPDGRLSNNFGKGFFDEASSHTIELINLQRKNNQK